MKNIIVIALLGGLLVSGCSCEGQYQSDALTPSMILQTNTRNGELRVCIVVQAARVANSYLNQVADQELLPEYPPVEQNIATEQDEELERRVQAILEREAAAEQARSPAERQRRERLQAAARIRADELVECTPWQAITPS